MKYILLAIATYGLFINCDSNNTDPILIDIEEDFSAIENPKERWDAYDLQNYYLKQSWHCYCIPPYGAEVYVQNNRIQDFSFISVHNATEKDKEYAESNLATVEDAFELIEEYQDTADSIRVVYHPRFGYPTELEINPSFSIADEEISYYFSDLKKVVSF